MSTPRPSNTALSTIPLPASRVLPTRAHKPLAQYTSPCDTHTTPSHYINPHIPLYRANNNMALPSNPCPPPPTHGSDNPYHRPDTRLLPVPNHLTTGFLPYGQQQITNPPPDMVPTHNRHQDTTPRIYHTQTKYHNPAGPHRHKPPKQPNTRKAHPQTNNQKLHYSNQVKLANTHYLKHRRGFKICNLNIRSLTKNFDPFKLEFQSSGIQVITLTETWLSKELMELLKDRDYFHKKARNTHDPDVWDLAKAIKKQSKQSNHPGQIRIHKRGVEQKPKQP